MTKGHPDYIVIEGPIGVGKTTLARRLADSFGTDLMLEGAEDNPFLPRFYEDPVSGALPTQLFFLFNRARQIQSLRQADMFRRVGVADFLMEKDRLFAQLTLSDDELALYNQVYEKLTLDAPVPDLVIYLQAPVEVLLKRISERGVPYERNIQEPRLARRTIPSCHVSMKTPCLGPYRLSCSSFLTGHGRSSRCGRLICSGALEWPIF